MPKYLTAWCPVITTTPEVEVLITVIQEISTGILDPNGTIPWIINPGMAGIWAKPMIITIAFLKQTI
jgi:hypothetical protein